MAPIVHQLRSWGIKLHAYLDVWLIRANYQSQASLYAQQIKCLLETSYKVEILGFHFNLQTSVISPPESFQVAMIHIWSHLSPGRSLLVRHIAPINSKVTHFALFIPMGRFNLLYLQYWLSDSLSPQQIQPDGMVIPSNNPKQSVLCIWYSIGRHVRNYIKTRWVLSVFALPGWESLGHRCPLNILGRHRVGLCFPSSPNHTQCAGENKEVSSIMITSENPSRLWYPLLLNCSMYPRIPLKDVQLFQFSPHLGQPEYHQDSGLLDLAAWLLSGKS